MVDEAAAAAAGVTPDQLADIEAEELEELEGRCRRWRRLLPRRALEERLAIVVDDGLATGATARAACRAARARGAERVVLAVPVAPARRVREMAGEADELVCVESPERLDAVSQAYDDFSPTSEGEVVALLGHRAAR